MSNLRNSLSNFMNSTSTDERFHVEISSDEKLNRLSAAPITQKIDKPKVKEEIHLSKYRLIRRQDEVILQHSKIHNGNLIWIDIPTIVEE